MDIKINLDTSSKKNYDESLFEVYTLDYGDNYHRLDDEPTSEFERQVRNLKARYKDLFKFNEALVIYDEWMDYLAEKYGGYDILKKKIKAGMLEDYVPRKPRLKNTKQLKYMYKNKIIVSKTSNRLIYEDKLDKLVKQLSKEPIDASEINIDVEDNNKDVKKISKEDDTIRTYKSKSFKSDSEFLESFFIGKNKSTSKSKKSKKKNKENKILISDFMKDDYEKYIEDSDNAPLMQYNGLLLSAGVTKDIDIYHKLDECGWQSYKLMKRANYSKRMTSMYKAQVKSKKKKKKSNYDELLIDIMTDNGYDDFEEYQKDMLSMTSSDVFK